MARLVCSIMVLIVLSTLTYGEEMLGNDSFKVVVSTPDDMLVPVQKGVVRFDLLGGVKQVTWDKQDFLSDSGLCDEFGILATPPGFNIDAMDSKFMKIGVGILIRNLEDKYQFYHPYPVDSTFKTTMKQNGNSVTFEQRSGDFQGYSYYYRKNIVVNPQLKTIKISYMLENTGKHEINTAQYNHNFFTYAVNLNNQNYRIQTKFTPEPERFTGNCFDYKNKVFSNIRMGNAGCYFVSFAEIKPADNEFILSHTDSPYKVIIKGDFLSRRFAVSFNEKKFLSPEIFINIDLMPGKKRTWSRTYKFVKTPVTLSEK